MKDLFENIVEFNELIVGIKRSDRGVVSASTYEFFYDAMAEEIVEGHKAGSDDNYIGQVDAVLDIIYFSVGMLHKLGLTPDEMRQAMHIVHEANMNKKSGSHKHKRTNGEPDAVKPEGWISPEERLTKLLLGG